MEQNIEYEFTIAGRPWRLKMGDILIDEWCELEEIYGSGAVEILAHFYAGSMKARKAMVFLARKRAGEGVAWDSPEMNFRMAEFAMKDITPKRRRPAKVEQAEPDPTQETAASPSSTK
jgi:hypothetical protein